uniref:26S proteasome complex subunit dss-1 n=1 Tax=Panagrolaimus sp. JU765 TaxID=591449 RepID=A0AC34Q7Z1_9BILA
MADKVATPEKKKSDFSLNNPNDPKPSANKNKSVIGLDDDDEFEEFPVDRAHMEGVEEDEKDTIWEDNWEDETVGEDFYVELSAELEKMGQKPMI